MSSLATFAAWSAVPSDTVVLGHRFLVGRALGGSRLLAVDTTGGVSVAVTRAPLGATLRVEPDEFVQQSRLLWAAISTPALVQVLDARDWDDDPYVALGLHYCVGP